MDTHQITIGMIIIDPEKELVLIASDEETGRLGFPTAHWQPDETPDMVVLRTTRDSLGMADAMMWCSIPLVDDESAYYPGLQVTPFRVRTVLVPRTRDYDEHTHVELDYIVTCDADTLNMGGRDAWHAVWMPRTALISPLDMAVQTITKLAMDAVERGVVCPDSTNVTCPLRDRGHVHTSDEGMSDHVWMEDE